MRTERIKWTSNMIEYLRENYHSTSNKELAEKLDVSLSALQSKLYAMGFHRGQKIYSRFQNDSYDKKLAFAKKLGHNNLAEAIAEMGIYDFNRAFKKQQN